MTLDFS